MTIPKLSWIVAGVLFAMASVAIHYEVKIAMHQRSGSVQALGQIKVSEPAPDFSLQDLSGQTVKLSSLRGRAVYIDFWATWCGPCKVALPGLQELTDELKNQGLEIVTIDQGESLDQVRSFIERKKYSFQVLLDPDGTVGNIYGVRALPTSVFVDRNGIVQSISVGNVSTADDIRKRFDRMPKG
jgi:peroxiredoxin